MTSITPPVEQTSLLTEDILHRHALYIDGQWVRTSHGKTVEVDEAATSKLLGTAAIAEIEEVDRAVEAARRALNGPWGRMTVSERASKLREFAAALKKRGRITTELVTRENGMPITMSKPLNGFSPAIIIEYFADLAEKLDVVDERPHFMGGRTRVLRHPIGVVAAITPWNYPHPQAAMKLGPALAAGNTVVFKPSRETAIDAFIFADAAHEVGLPAGVLNVLPAARQAGSYLVSHPGVNKVAFTGSTEAGRTVGQSAMQNFTAVTLELGGKSAAIVTPDADLEKFLAGLHEYSFGNNGQTCHASTRILLPREQYSTWVDAITDTVRSYTVGSPLERDTQIGPMVTSTHRDRVLSYIELGQASDARMTTGGTAKPAGVDEGWFVQPTVFADVDNSQRIMREEIFGPVICLAAYDTIDQAIEIANDSEYGLGGMVWTEDEQEGIELASRIEAGAVGINTYGLDPGAPFGGVKDSGLGRELGPEGLEAFWTPQSLYLSTPIQK